MTHSAAMNWTIHQPLRVVVVQRGITRGRTFNGRGKTHRGAYSAIAVCEYAVNCWTEDTTAEPWRAGYGSFLFSNIHKTREAIQTALADPRTRQVQVRTNQDRTWFVCNRNPNGSFTSYDARED